MANRKLRAATGTLVALTMGASVSTAMAQSAAVFKIQDTGKLGGEKETDGGAGYEQAATSYIQKGDDVYLVTVGMTSVLPQGDLGNWECACSSIKLGKDGMPQEVVRGKLLTAYSNGDRLCNHPDIASDGTNLVWVYGSDNNNANVQTYAQVINEKCEALTEHVRISANANNNEGAPDIAFNGTVDVNGVPTGRFTSGYLSAGNNVVAVGLNVTYEGGQAEIKKVYGKNIINPANIGRPTILSMGKDRSLFCAAQGDQRPPEDGISCALLDTSYTGEQDGQLVLWKEIIAASDPQNKIYMNQPSLANLEYGRAMLLALESNGQGKQTNNKGANVAHLYAMDITDAGYTVKHHEKPAFGSATHSTLCGAKFGPDGLLHAVLAGAPVTGTAPAKMQYIGYDSIDGIKNAKGDGFFSAGWYGDSGLMANQYGHNPNTQGRDFLRCTGDVPNPAYGNAAGFMPYVKSFTVIPYAGRDVVAGDEKNSGYVSLIPGVTDAAVNPQPPKDAKDIGLGYGSGPKPGDPNNPEIPGSDDGDGSGSPIYQPNSAGGCSMSGTRSDASVAILAIAAAMMIRRRKGA